jgi:thiol-disulfide isomerase/thioredoxin
MNSTRPVADLPIEAQLASLAGATGWLNSAPLTTDGLRGNVVLVDFWTYTCINWLRTLAYVRAWAQKYEDQGLVVVGVHTPEFPFEREPTNVRTAAGELRVGYPIALDNHYAIWSAFGNHYWPAVYIADTQGRIRHHQFGEGGYDECERVIQLLLSERGGGDVSGNLVDVAPDGVEAQADWRDLKSPETYLGQGQTRNFASPGGARLNEQHSYVAPDQLILNHWGLSGEWTVERGASVLNGAAGQIAFRYRARDVNLVIGLRGPGGAVPFRVLVDGEPPGDAHGLDVDGNGHGAVVQERLYQLIRTPGSITERTVEISFLAPGVEAYVFTFG